MKRKMKRRKAPKPNKKDPLAPSPLGGFLPDPSEDCPAKEFFIEKGGRYFIDLQICLRHCGDLLCDRHKKYTKAQRERRQVYLESIKPVKKEENGNS